MSVQCESKLDTTLTDPILLGNWENITEDFFENVEALKLGELLHDNMFGLVDAMSAIEMMDPKMDSGMSKNTNESYMKFNHLSVNEQICIIDTTWASVVSWLEGNLLAQTVFTNRYMYHLDLCKKPLKAFFISIYKFIDIIQEFIEKGLVFGDDFQPLMIYGCSPAPDISDTKAVRMLKDAEEELTKTKNDDILIRIHFTRVLIQALLHLKNVSADRVSASSKLLWSCIDQIPKLIETNCKSCPAYTTDFDPINIGFDPLLNQKHIPPKYPTYAELKSAEESYKMLEQLMRRMIEVMAIINDSTFHPALEKMLEISSTKPDPVSRSIMQILFLPKCKRIGRTINCLDALKDAANDFISPPVLSQSPLLNNPQANSYLECFLLHCIRPFSNLIQIFSHNRARQRETFVQVLDDFANLQQEASKVDELLNNLLKNSDSSQSHLACFSTWILYYTVRIMILFLLTGFELELYSIHEYHYVYWYLYEFLYGWLISSLSLADAFRTDANETKKLDVNNSNEIAQSHCLKNMCCGYYKALVAMKNDNKITYPNPEFDNEMIRYQHRFAPFMTLNLTPPGVEYSEFKEATSQLEEEDPLSLYSQASKLFLEAKTSLESLQNQNQEILDLIKVSESNFTSLNLFATGENSSTPKFDFTVHHHFPTIKI